jgi:ankyrin repeat protein
MQKLTTRIMQAAAALFLCTCLLAYTGCSSTPSIPEGFDIQGWLTSVADGETKAVKAGLDLGVPATTRRADGLSALQIAVRNGRHETARTLIEAGADVNEPGSDGLPPIFYAIYRDDAGMVKLLLHSGTHLEGQNRYTKDPVTLALSRRDIPVITELALADSGAEKKVRQWIDQQDAATEISNDQGSKFLCLRGVLGLAAAKDLESALEAEEILIHVAGLFGDESMEARYTLLKAYSDTSSLLFDLYKAEHRISDYYYSQSKLEAAFFAKRAASGSEPLAAYLYGRALRTSNISTDTPDHPGSKLILESARAGNIFAQADLGEKYDDYFPGASEDEIRREKLAWLQRAADAGLSEAAYNLAYIYVHDHWVPRDLEKALFWFNRSGELGSCYVYRRIGYNFQQGNENFPVDLKRAVEWSRKGSECGDLDAMTVLAEAYEEGKLGLPIDYLEAVKYYLPNSDNHEKAFALAAKGLVKAVQDGDIELVGKWLAILPPDNTAFLDGWLAAAESNNPALAGKFLEAGVDVNCSPGDQTALMIAALHGHGEMIAWLLEHGSDINGKNAFGGTALSLAAGQGHLDIAQLFLEKGAVLNGMADSPNPLVQAVRGGHHDMVRLLLDKGAKMPDIESADGKKLLEFIRQIDDPKMRKMERMLLEAQPENISPATIEKALNQLAERHEAANKKELWLAGKLIVRRDEQGKPLSIQDGSYDVTPWRCISDEMSGLSWLVKDDSGGLHDKDLMFSMPGGTSSECRPGDCDVFAYRDKARGDQVCGNTDWRVPTVEELKSLAYPHLAESFPFWPGFVLWAHLEEENYLMLTHASGLFGRTTGGIAFNTNGQVLLVRGRLQQLPVESMSDYTIIAID